MSPPPSFADGADCTTSAGLGRTSETCTIPGTDAQTMVHNSTVDHHQYSFEPNCKNGAQKCMETPTCPAEGGGQGEDMIMFQDGTPIGETCWTGPTRKKKQPTPDQVMRAARSLSWPAATLVIQPPDGETLVNLATNFYSTTTAAATRTVRLLDTQVTIEATPAAYLWRFGDGAALTSTKAGAAYPHLEITHRYPRKGTVRPRVDLTYRGRYRLDGGPWQQLPATLTVAGTPQRLRVLTASPHLTG